jgi:site-specific DNA-cytosine methylase
MFIKHCNCTSFEQRGTPMKELIFDVEGLTDDQIELAREFIEMLKKTSEKASAYENLKRLLYKGNREEEEISDQEADAIASEAVAWSRRKRKN